MGWGWLVFVMIGYQINTNHKSKWAGLEIILFNFYLRIFNQIIMGKGDIRSKKGKLKNGSYGRLRSRKALKLKKKRTVLAA